MTRFIVFAIILLSIPTLSFADEMISVMGPSGSAKSACGAFDPDCSRHLLAVLDGIHVAPIQVQGGVRFGSGAADGAIRFDVQGAAMDVPAGDLEALAFEAVYVPDLHGVRIRFTLAHAEALYFCKDENGKEHPPLLAILQNCQPESLGVGATIFQFQKDTETGRAVTRVIEGDFVYNFLKNGNTLDYLNKRLLLFLGSSLDVVSPGYTPGMTPGLKVVPRLNIGITGMIRSNNHHWEISGYAGYRPDFVQWDDYAIEVRMRALYHILFTKTIMGDFGVDAEYDHWSVPGESMGAYASDTVPDTGYVGAMFGLTFQ